MRRIAVVALFVGLAGSACGSRSGLWAPSEGDPGPRANGADAGRVLEDGSARDDPRGPGSIGADAGPGADAAVCPEGRFGLSSEPVDVVIVLDASLSMGFGFDGRPIPTGEDRRSRWETVRSGIAEVRRTLDERVTAGVKLFPSRRERGLAGACEVLPGLDYPLGPAALGELTSDIGAMSPSGGSPLGPAIYEAGVALRDRPGAGVIVVITDGAPTCSDRALADALDEITSARERLGLVTSVVGLGGNALERRGLDRMAVAGGRPLPEGAPERFHRAETSIEAVAAIGRATREVTRCVLPIPPSPPEADVVVEIDGRAVPRDPERGWDFTGRGRSQIGFFGESCARLVERDGSVVAEVTCP